jgi:SAM-dependent methyltransferase
MKLLRQLPQDRSYEQILNHYLVEKSIANRLKESNREERRLIYKTMYEQLFSQVPDHPRLTRRESIQLTRIINKEKFSLIYKFLDKSFVFVEFAPGDCRFAFEVANHVKEIYGIDISDQRNPSDIVPKNFKLIIYDGYNLNEIASNSVDIVFSDQLIEHFHPEDTELHFKLVKRILKPGGKYIFRTPHPFSGPHDVSQFFCDDAEGFHLKEWTYAEIKSLITGLKYSDFSTRWRGRGIDFRLPYSYFAICEHILSLFPKRHVKKIAKYFIPTLYVIAIK